MECSCDIIKRLVCEKFEKEIEQGAVVFDEFTPEVAALRGCSFDGWRLAIEKMHEGRLVRRVVLREPGEDVRVDLGQEFVPALRTLIDVAREKLEFPPFPKTINQGALELTGSGVLFEDIEELRET